MILSLKTTSYAAALFVAMILGVLLLLGSRQHRSHQNFEKIIEQNEKVIFQFAAIREHISECLLENRHQQLKDITAEVEKLNSNISQILQEPQIPDQYKLSFASQVDLTGITLLLRAIGSGDLGKTKIRQLNQEVRILGERLMLFDRVIVNHVKRKLVGFQSVIIGILAIAVFLIINILLFWYRHFSAPLFNLIRQTKEVIKGKRPHINLTKKSGEISELACLTENLIHLQWETNKKLERQDRLLSTANKIKTTTRLKNSRDIFFSEACKAILTNDEYCLAWIGIDDGQGNILPIVADGSTTMSLRDCEECMTGLLDAMEEKGHEYNASLLAVQERNPVVLKDILSGIPKGTFKNTPFAEGFASCAALPISYNEKKYGILNVYSTSPESFPDSEINLLKNIADDLSSACYILETNNTLYKTQLLNQWLTESINIMTVTISLSGDVLSINSEAVQFIGKEAKDILEQKWISLLPTNERQYHTQLCQSLIEGADESVTCKEMQLYNKNGARRTIRYNYAVTRNRTGHIDDIIWSGVDISEPLWSAQSQRLMLSTQKELFETSNDIIIIFDDKGIIVEINPCALSKIKYPGNKIIGSNIHDVLFNNAELPVEFIEALKNGISKTDINVENLGGEYNVTISQLNCDDDERSYKIFVAKEIGLHKKHTKEIIKISKLAAMGELAVDVAHEINNLSNGMINYSQLLSEELPDTTEEKNHLIELLSNIIEEGEGIAKIVQQLLAFNSNRNQVIETVQIEKVIQDSLSLINHQLKHDGIQTETKFPLELPPVRINTQKMQHVFLNLLSNARHSLNLRYSGRNENKRLEIKGETESSNGQRLLKIHITDWGIGISPDITHKLFEPFFSTKSAGEGTGLGLSISKGIILEQHGDINIESIPDDHTTITVGLPIS